MKIYLICSYDEAEKFLDVAKEVKGVNAYIKRRSELTKEQETVLRDTPDEKVIIQFTTRSAAAMYDLGRLHGIKNNFIFGLAEAQGAPQGCVSPGISQPDE